MPAINSFARQLVPSASRMVPRVNERVIAARAIEAAKAPIGSVRAADVAGWMELADTWSKGTQAGAGAADTGARRPGVQGEAN